jgi:hypothetical protein
LFDLSSLKLGAAGHLACNEREAKLGAQASCLQ